MKKLWVLWVFIFLADFAGAQVKKNDAGMYIDADGFLYTGVIDNKENGVVISEMEIKNGLPNGEATYYYASGKKMETGVFQDGKKDGKWQHYNENGVLVGLAVYNSDKKDGIWIVWDDAGKKRFEMHYDKGQKTGIWSNWDENGALVATKDYSHLN